MIFLPVIPLTTSKPNTEEFWKIAFWIVVIIISLGVIFVFGRGFGSEWLFVGVAIIYLFYKIEKHEEEIKSMKQKKG